MHPERHVADKCTWCYHRIKVGKLPACVEACPTGARVFGDLNDPDSEISKVLAEKRTDVLKSYLGTRPKTRYIGLTAEVV
jgi:Fe-S-cluster-containing dehydrogenase component